MCVQAGSTHYISISGRETTRKKRRPTEADIPNQTTLAQSVVGCFESARRPGNKYAAT